MADNTPKLLRLDQFQKKHPCFKMGTLRDIVFKSKPRKTSRGPIPGNGFEPAIVRLNNLVFVDENQFFVCLREHNSNRGGSWQF